MPRVELARTEYHQETHIAPTGLNPLADLNPQILSTELAR